MSANVRPAGLRDRLSISAPVSVPVPHGRFLAWRGGRGSARREVPSGAGLSFTLASTLLTALFTTRFSVLLAIVCATLTILAQPERGYAQEGGFVDPVGALRGTVLDNGLRVYTLEDHRTPVVSFQIWVQAGSKDETRYTGLAHLFEHMMFKGSEHLGPERHAQLVQSRGGRINAFTNRDVTVYHEDVTAESLPLVIDLEAERFGSLNVGEKTLTSEREVVLEERRMRYEDRASGRAFEALSALAWQAHPYRWPVIGWRSDVEAVTVEASRAFFDTYYAPNNFIVVVVGDFETDETLAHVTRAFGALERGPDVVRSPTREPEQRGERRATVEFEVQASLVYAAWHAPPTGHEDGPALDVASQVLSGGRSSRLYRSLVYDAQVATYASAYYIEFMHAGLFYANAGVRPGESIDEVEALLFAEIGRAVREGVSEQEVAKAKQQLEVSLVRGMATNHALADRIGLEISFFGKVRSLQSRIDAIRQVTVADVDRVLQTYLKDERRSVVRVIPPVGDGVDQ
jgi:zinc protease